MEREHGMGIKKKKKESKWEGGQDGWRGWESESKEKYSKLWKGRHGSWRSKQNVHVNVDIFPHSLAHNFSCLVLCRYNNGLGCLFYLDYSATGPPDVCTSFATIPRTGSKHMSVIFFLFCFLFLAPCWRLFTPTCPHVHFLFLSPTPSPPHGPHTQQRWAQVYTFLPDARLYLSQRSTTIKIPWRQGRIIEKREMERDMEGTTNK